MSEDRKSNAAWFVTGLGFGSLVGILLAPRSGRETREAIATEADRGRKYLVSLGRDARKHLSDIADSGKKMFARKTKQVGAAIDTGRKRVQELLKQTA